MLILFLGLDKTVGHFRVPKTLTFKMRLGVQPLCENEFYLHENEK